MDKRVATTTAVKKGPAPNLLLEVQKKISGTRPTPLSAEDLYRLFQLDVTPELNLTVWRGLQRQAIDPDTTLLQLLPHATTTAYLVPISICLRYGANYNMYVDAPSIGIVHLLAYAYFVLSNSPTVLETLIPMLIAAGANPGQSVYDRKPDSKVVEAAPYSISRTRPVKMITVANWLQDQGYDTRLTADKNVTNLSSFASPDTLTTISILLDNPALVGRPYEDRDYFTAIRSLSVTVLPDIPAPAVPNMMDYKSLFCCVIHFHAAAFDNLVTRGQQPSYLLINTILIEMKKYEGRLPFAELQEMLVTSVKNGTTLDQDQMNLVSSLGRDSLASITKGYEEPYWRKICRSPVGGVPDQLRSLAISLNLHPEMSKSALCENISLLAATDKEALKEAGRRRQQLRLSSQLGTVSEFLEGKTPSLVPRNRSLLPYDPFTYNDQDIVFYRDDQGSIWAFGRERFQNLLETKVNPYNGAQLPSLLLSEIELKESRPSGLSFSTAVDRLTDKDVPGQSSTTVVDQFLALALQYNVSPETIKSLTKNEMTEALKAIGYDPNLDPLTTPHALITTAHLIMWLNQTDPAIVRDFFSTVMLQESNLPVTRLINDKITPTPPLMYPSRSAPTGNVVYSAPSFGNPPLRAVSYPVTDNSVIYPAITERGYSTPAPRAIQYNSERVYPVQQPNTVLYSPPGAITYNTPAPNGNPATEFNAPTTPSGMYNGPTIEYNAPFAGPIITTPNGTRYL